MCVLWKGGGGGGGGGRSGRSGDTPTKFFHVREVYLPFPSLFIPPPPPPPPTHTHTHAGECAHSKTFFSFKFVSDRLTLIFCVNNYHCSIRSCRSISLFKKQKQKRHFNTFHNAIKHIFAAKLAVKVGCDPQ